MRKQTWEKIRQWQQEPETKELKVEYLKGVCTSEVMRTLQDIATYERFKDLGETDMYILFGQYIKEDIDNLMELKKNIMTKQVTSDVTPDMIQIAKDYPFEELYPFKRGMALCPFHPDSKPSMSLKHNRVRCWSCMDKSMDTIEFLQKLEGLGFREAVRRLQ